VTFAQPQLFWLLLLPAALLFAALRKARTTTSSARPNIPRVLLHGSTGPRPRASSLRTARPVALCLGLAAAILGLARPQGATLPSLAKTNAREVLVAVDVSRSMLADDLKPDRLSRARLLIRALLDELKGERIGLLPFAGTAFLQSPLSADYEIFRTFLDELGPAMIPAGGSDFAALLTTASDAFSSGDADRFLIVLSDGEAQNDSWRAPAETLSKRGVRVIALGLGTTAGAMVPDGNGGLVKDDRGAAVLSRLDATTLRELARVTGGEYRDATAFVDLPALLRATIAQGRAGHFEETDATRRVELFAWFLAPALLLLAYALWLEFPPVPSPRKTHLIPSASTPPLRATVSSAARAAIWLLILQSTFVISHSSFAATTSAPPATPAPDPLVALVGKLSSSSSLAASDLATLAELTASRGEEARSSGKPLPDGALHDALAAVEKGQVTTPSAADWPALRKRLETLLAPPPQPPKQDDSKSKDSPDKKDQSKDQSKDDSKSDQSDKSDSAKDSSTSDNNKSGKPSDSSSSDSKPSSSPDDSGKAAPDAKDPPSSSKPSEEKPLSDLSSPSKDDTKKQPEKDSKAASAADSTPPPEPPTPDASSMQQAGGVATDGASPDADPTSADPALALPRQRLEVVRASDSPARLYQLLNNAETPPDASRKNAVRKHDW